MSRYSTALAKVARDEENRKNNTRESILLHVAYPFAQLYPEQRVKICFEEQQTAKTTMHNDNRRIKKKLSPKDHRNQYAIST